MATDALFRMTSQLAAAGKTATDETPKPPAMAVFLDANPDMVYLTFLPVPVQKLLFKLLAPIGRLVGYAADYPPVDHLADE